MKSLDEVIEQGTECQKHDNIGCARCPYSVRLGGNMCGLEWIWDGLYYLKEYKASLEKPLSRRLIAVLREVRGEVK